MNNKQEKSILKNSGGKHNQFNKSPVIALCGSAGSLHDMEIFFQYLPAETGIVFIVVIHLPSANRVDVPSLLRRSTPLPIIEVRDGISILPNHIYVIPPKRKMIVQNDKLLFSNAINHSQDTIDSFLYSLTEQKQYLVIAIIFSGIGNDGEEGIKKIKAEGGLVFVQDPETARYKDMPIAAQNAQVANFVSNPKNLARKLVHYFNLPTSNVKSKSSTPMSNDDEEILQQILLSLKLNIGHDFTLYKKNTIYRRIERRIAATKLTDLKTYYHHIINFPQEMEFLFKELLIGVTKFFRDPDAYQALAKLLNQKMLIKEDQEPIRAWVAGCSTGEEAYSLAILIREFFDQYPHKTNRKVQIFASDLDIDAIEYARKGFYPDNLVEDISEKRLQRFFDKKNNGWVVKKELREMIVFAKHNLVKDAPFTKLDLLSCRNVMIYFSAALQRKLLPIFHYSLLKKGLLFIGPAETIGIYNDAFDMLDSKWKIFERNNEIAHSPKIIDFPFHIGNPIVREIPSKTQNKPIMTNSFQKLLIEHYTPVALLVDDKGDILYINGNINRYLQLNAGEAIMNVHRILKEELRYPIGSGIHQVWMDKTNTKIEDLKFEVNNQIHELTVEIDYLKEKEFAGLILVTFTDYGESKKKRKIKMADNSSSLVNELEKDLEFTKQQLTNTIEQMESSVEELKSTNEELQSTNEELQSTNEEALTTKEEMQSLNEELMTINLQYQNKAEELTRLNNDMKNLLDNTDVSTIFLDNHLNIVRFTPQITKLFNLGQEDVGKSITQVIANFDYPGLDKVIFEVIDRLAAKDLEFRTKKNEWYNIRIIPYRTTDNFINGAVLTFTKITQHKLLEAKYLALRGYVQSIIDDMDAAAIVLDKDQKVLAVNRLFLEMFKMTAISIIDHFLMSVVINRWHADKLMKRLSATNDDEKFLFDHHFPDIGLLKLMIAVKYIYSPDSNEKI